MRLGTNDRTSPPIHQWAAVEAAGIGQQLVWFDRQAFRPAASQTALVGLR
jgi:hypothetical protein